ncbi:MAG: hypothetical protein ABJ056_04745 [Halioglobus sp.]
MSVNETRVRFGGLPEFQVAYYSINEIDTIEDGLAGYYSWIYIPETKENISAGVVKKRNVISTVKEGFSNNYHGELVRREVGGLAIDDEDRFLKFQELMFAFSAPLYIGISNNLRSRLKTHKRQLAECYETWEAMEPDTDFRPIDSRNLDTDIESKCFGQRIARILQTEGLRLDELYIKCVRSEGGDDLKSNETILNKICAPPYGVR